MSRRSLLGFVAVVAALAFPTSALALVSSCGGGSVLPGQLSPPSSQNFQVDYDGIASPLTAQDYLDAAEAAYARQVTTEGWWKPPGSGKYQIVVAGDPPNGGQATPTGSNLDNPNSPWTETDAKTSCLWLDDTYASKAALNSTVAREFNRMVLIGIGALTPAPDPTFSEGGPKVLEQDVRADADVADLYPDFTKPLLEYDAKGWFPLRGIAERYGTSAVLKDFWEAQSRGPATDLAALETALAKPGRDGLAAAFHDYAIAAKYLHQCPLDSPFCFAQATLYAAAGNRPNHATIATAGGPAYDGTINDQYAIQWIGLPGLADVTVANTAAGGTLRATATCLRDGAIVRNALPQPLGAGESGTIKGFPPAGCSAPTLVLTTGAAPASAARTYRVSANVAMLDVTASVSGTGTGTVTSLPAGITCPADCTEAYVAGTEVTLTAAPAEDSLFAGWGGACSGTQATCKFTPAAATAVVATFTKKPSDTGTGGTTGGTGSTTPPVTPPTAGGPTTPVSLTSDHTGPKVKIVSAKASRTSLAIKVSCPSAEVNRCSGFLTLTGKARRKSLKFEDQAFVKLAGGSSRTLKFRFTARTRALIRHLRSVRVKALVRARDDAFNYATTSRSLTVKLRK